MNVLDRNTATLTAQSPRQLIYHSTFLSSLPPSPCPSSSMQLLLPQSTSLASSESYRAHLRHHADFDSRYWGKRDTKLILPTNSSLSVTLNQDHLRSTTTSRADPSFTEDTLWLNGKVDEIKPGGRLATCISEMKRLRKELEDANPNAEKVCPPSILHK